MKFYIAGRTSQIKTIQKMVATLTDLGHEITYDWTRTEDPDLKRPYNEHLEKVSFFAEKDINGAKNAEIFIIIGDASGTGMYVELGVALASGAKVYAIGEYNDVTIFHFHPQVTRYNTFEEVLDDLLK